MGFTEYIIDNNAVLCNLECRDWKEAILKGGDILLKNGAASQVYLDNIIRKCEENGPYIVIAPGMAMPHARPEEGALALGYGLVTLKEPVNFGDPDNDPVELLIFMAAPDVKQHNETAITQIADLCDDEPLIEKILKAESADEIINILK